MTIAGLRTWLVHASRAGTPGASGNPGVGETNVPIHGVSRTGANAGMLPAGNAGRERSGERGVRMLKMTDSSPKPVSRYLCAAAVLALLAGSPIAVPVASGQERPAWEIEEDAAARNRQYQERMRDQYQERKRLLDNLKALDPASLTPAQQRQMDSLQRTIDEMERAGVVPADEGQGLAVRENGAMGFRVEDPDEMINLDFTEPVALSVNDEPITFKAPVQVRAGDLPLLLSTLLADRQAAMVRGDLGWYRIVTEDRVPVNVGDDGLATTRIVPTPMIRPSSLQQVLTETFPPNALKISPVDELGVIVLTGGASQLTQAERFIGMIVEERASLKLHRLPMVHVSADFARQRIIDLDGVVNQTTGPIRPGGQGQAQPATGSLTNLGSFLYVDAGNALLFRGSEGDFERVKELASVVDIVSPLVAKRYVAGSLAMQIAKAGEQLGLGTLTSAEDGASQFTPGRQNLSAMGVGQQTAPSQFGSSRFVVDPESGSFVYHGTPEQQERVKELVDDFRSQAIDTGVEIRIYKLVYAQAGGDGGSGSASGAARGGGSTRGGSGGASLALSGSNTTQPTGPGVAELLEALINNEEEATGRFLPGGGGQASVMNTDVINDILAEDEPDLNRLDQALAADAAASGGTDLSATSDNTRIVADTARNQLIIRAPARVHEQLGRIIEQLDRPRRQVQVEVKIVSLTLTDSFDFAADVQFNSGDFSLLSTFGVTSPGASITTPVGVGAASGSGLTAAVIRSDYVPIAINALQRTGDARIVSTPSILVNDNQEGNIRSVREEPTEVTNQTSGNPTTTSQGPFVEAGTELVVRPQIAGDNSVSLNFAIEVSNFDSANRRGNLTPPKQTEAYNSVVSVPSNTTIVVGGFRFEELSESISKIPFIGDIPLVGELFRSTQKRDQTRVIYVFITPTVISETGQRDLRLLTEGPLKDSDISVGQRSLDPAMIPLSSVRVRDVRPDLAAGNTRSASPGDVD